MERGVESAWGAATVCGIGKGAEEHHIHPQLGGGDCLRSTKDKQDNVEKLKMEIEKAWRTADATHVEALENIENLRQQLSRLQNERGVKSKLDFDQNGDRYSKYSRYIEDVKCELNE
ncbi:uncharacterized protein LOC120349465 [Nilaparvata lugens]|uniref:uncharacterized protein LOC120349465 n=1 Tax=Nilaparvata lugens TaxID=108931 RepID=UPI00193C9A70|nr:uncharacterized protein LOC120349465 [Nilaparvata lugens]